MDSPFVIALIVFFSIFAMFFLMRLFADMYIVTVALVASGAAYFIPTEYAVFRKLFNEDMSLDILGIKLAEQPDLLSIYLIAFSIMLFAVLVCLPALPFSATYRQILGANRLSPSEELKIKRWIEESVEPQETARFQED